MKKLLVSMIIVTMLFIPAQSINFTLPHSEKSLSKLNDIMKAGIMLNQKYITGISSFNTPFFISNHSIYMQRWNNTISSWETMMKAWQNTMYYEINYIQSIEPYFIDVAKRQAIQYVVYPEWNATLEQKLLEDTGFNDVVRNITLSALYSVGLIFDDMVQKIDTIEYSHQNFVGAYFYNNPQQSYNLMLKGDWNLSKHKEILWFGDESNWHKANAWKDDSYRLYLNKSGNLYIYIDNTSDVLDLVNSHAYFVWEWYRNPTNYSVWYANGMLEGSFQGQFDVKIPYFNRWTHKFEWQQQFHSYSGWGYSVIHYGKSSRYIGFDYYDVNNVFSNLYNVVSVIANDMKQQAHATWQAYKNGYNVQLHIPYVNMNFSYFNNLSYRDGMIIWYSVLEQLKNMSNTTTIKDSNFNITDYTGKEEVLTLKYHNTAIFFNHHCIILSYKYDLGYNVNSTFQGSKNIAIFDLNDSKYYALDNNYSFTISKIIDNGNVVNSVMLPVKKLDDFTYSHFGFYFTPHSNSNNSNGNNNNNNDSSDNDSSNNNTTYPPIIPSHSIGIRHVITTLGIISLIAIVIRFLFKR